MKYLLFTFLVLFLINCSPSNDEKKGKDKIALSGEKIYTTYCLACHGADGAMGFSGATNLKTSMLSLDDRIHVIAKGRKAMNAFKGILSEEEIEKVSLYIEDLRD